MTSKSSADTGKRAEDAMSVDQLRDKVAYLLYEKQDLSEASRYVHRLRKLVQDFDPAGESIITQECLSLAYEVEGDLKRAIGHREKEIHLIRRLHELAQGPDAAHADFLLEQYSYEDLSVRLDLLAILYHESGDLGKAIRTLLKSKQLCQDHGIKFEGEEILRDYLKEHPNVPLKRRR